MSKTTRLNFLSAAHRHLRDAQHLATHPQWKSLDQAYHLAGFAPECARKAVLKVRDFDHSIGHGVGGEDALNIALALDPAARRYDIQGWKGTLGALSEWNAGCRYESTGTRTAVEVQSLISEACQVVEALSFAMWADGEVPGEFSW